MPAKQSRHEVLTLADLVIENACASRPTLGRVTTLDLYRVDEGSWNRVIIEYALLYLFLVSEHAHQVLSEEPALALVSEVADRVNQGMAHRLAAARIDHRAVMVYFGETLKERFALYQRQPLVVDPDAGESIEVESFASVQGTVFGSFVEHVGPLLTGGTPLPAAAALDLWVDTLMRTEAFARVYTPVVDLAIA